MVENNILITEKGAIDLMADALGVPAAAPSLGEVRPDEETAELIYEQFYAGLRQFYADLRDIKLV
jgi:serine/threonine-protein kinase RIO1